MNELYLLSTVVAPEFRTGLLAIEELTQEQFLELLPKVTRNLCGHKKTDELLRQHCPTLPDPERAFWNGDGEAIAARPKGGVRGAKAEGDTDVTLDTLEYVRYVWVGGSKTKYPEYWYKFIRDFTQ